VGGGWQESVDNHTSTTAGKDKQRERAVNVEGSNKEAKGGKSNGE
jgi:hypothetical protein